MLCEKCGKNTATVHTMQIINGVKTEAHLCPACAAQNGVEMRDLFDEFQTSFMLPGMLRGVMGFMPVIPAFIAQPMAQTQTARPEPPVLGVDGQPMAQAEDALAQLRRELQNAITAENFEEAARLRDEIRARQG